MRRRHLLKLSAAATLLPTAYADSAWAEGAFPNRPLVIVCPWPAGGGTDVATRAIADALSKELGQAVQVENRTGASGAIGLGYVARSPADGYLLATATADTHSINPQLRPDLPYDAANGFIPLAIYGTTSWAWMARSDFPVSNVQDLVRLAKQKPGQISYASWGIGSTAHLAGALLESAAGMELNHVPFAGSAPALTAIQGGHVDLMPVGRASANDLRKAGKVKVIGISAPVRSATLLTDVPTLAEQGLVGAEAGSWYGISVRRGIPEPVRERLQQALVKVLALPETVARITTIGMDPVSLHGDAAERFLRAEYERYGAVIRKKKIQAA